MDRQALPPAQLAASAAYEPPQGEAEEALAQIWAEVLGIERVGRHDNFFQLGGHSLSAIKAAGSLRRRHGMLLPLRAVFEAPTIAALVQDGYCTSASLASRRAHLAVIDELLSAVEE